MYVHMYVCASVCTVWRVYIYIYVCAYVKFHIYMKSGSQESDLSRDRSRRVTDIVESLN